MRRLFPYLLPFAILAVTFYSVVLLGGSPLLRSHIPLEAFSPNHCTWACHNQGCKHAPKIPGTLTSDKGAFGGTIRALYGLGTYLSKDRSQGYGAANLLVFCILWPGVTYGLWVCAVRQRRIIRRLKSKEST
jgi:hypothetical protein